MLKKIFIKAGAILLPAAAGLSVKLGQQNRH